MMNIKSIFKNILKKLKRELRIYNYLCAKQNLRERQRNKPERERLERENKKARQIEEEWYRHCRKKDELRQKHETELSNLDNSYNGYC